MSLVWVSCSKLSKTRSGAEYAAKAFITASHRSASNFSDGGRRRASRAIRSPTPLAFSTSARFAQKTACPKAGASRTRVASSASRVFPIPPGPVSVTKRRGGVLPVPKNNSHSREISDSRPKQRPSASGSRPPIRDYAIPPLTPLGQWAKRRWFASLLERFPKAHGGVGARKWPSHSTYWEADRRSITRGSAPYRPAEARLSKSATSVEKASGLRRTVWWMVRKSDWGGVPVGSS